MHTIEKIFEKIYKMLLAMAGAFLVIMILVIFANVVLRYFFNTGIYWSEEISLTLVVWFTFIAFALGVKENRHININILPANMPEKFIVFLNCLKYVIQIIVAVLFIVYGSMLALSMLEFTYTSIPITASLRYIFVPISGIFVLYFSIKSLLSKKKREENKNGR